MKVIFKTDKLKKLMNDFYNCTKTPITLFDSTLNCIYACGKPQKFCDNFSLDPVLGKECDLSNRIHAIQAKQSKSTLIYTCHAGITEAVAPIFYGEMIIAYIMIGRFRDKEKYYSSEEKVIESLKKYNLDSKKLLKQYETMPLISKSEIDSAISILEICIKHIWSESLIGLSKNNLVEQIETYIDSHYNDELTVASLCRTFSISKQSLYDVFKTEFNDTIKNYILKKRIDEALKLLKTDKKVSGAIAPTSSHPKEIL